MTTRRTPMFLLRLECGAGERERLLAELSDTRLEGIIEHELPGDGFLLEVFFENKSEAVEGAVRLRGWNVELESYQDVDWVAHSQQQWEPVLAGERFFLVPAWRDDPAPEGRLRLVMPPGAAAGTGLHPATQLALEGLERRFRSGVRIFDLGTGSGILAMGAILLGANDVVACDIETEAVQAAAAYLREFRAPVLLFAGSARSLRSGTVDLLVANLNGITIRQLAGEMVRVLAPDGEIVVTGFERNEAERIAGAFTKLGLACRDRIESNGWVCLVCGRR